MGLSLSIGGVSVHGRCLCPGGCLYSGGLCPGGSLSRGGGLCPGGLCQEPPVLLRAAGMHPTGMHSCYVLLSFSEKILSSTGIDFALIWRWFLMFLSRSNKWYKYKSVFFLALSSVVDPLLLCLCINVIWSMFLFAFFINAKIVSLKGIYINASRISHLCLDSFIVVWRSCRYITRGNTPTNCMLYWTMLFFLVKNSSEEMVPLKDLSILRNAKTI